MFIGVNTGLVHTRMSKCGQSLATSAIEGTMNKSGFRAGEIAQWLRALTALPKDLVQFPAPTWQLTTLTPRS